MTPLVVFAAAWAVGIVLAQAALFSPVWFLLTLPVALVLFYGWRQAWWCRRVLWALAGLLLGAGRLVIAQPALGPDQAAYYANGRTVTLTGVVTGEPDRRPRTTYLRVAAEQLAASDVLTRPVQGRVLVQIPVYTAADYGDRIQVVGRLEEPPVLQDFDYRAYLAQRGIHAVVRQAEVTVLAGHQASRLWEALYRFKARALAVVLTMLPEPEASLLSGILLGVESGIPAAVTEAFATTGTSHIVAISGFNLTIVAGIFLALAHRLVGRRWEAPVALAGIWLYTALVGAGAAVVRAALMGSVAILARREERRVHGPTSLATAALVMLAANPWTLWDGGFQLSVAATAGLILYTEPLTQGFRRVLTRLTDPARAERIVGWLSDALIVTLAAQVTTTPILVALFHRLSVVTLLTNLLILPVQPFVMIWGGLALIAGLLWLPAGQFLSAIAWVFLHYTIQVVQWTARWPNASVPIQQAGPLLVWGYYALLAVATGWWSTTRERRQQVWAGVRRVATWQAAGGLALVVLAGFYVTTLPDGRLHCTFLDVGQGDAIFIQTPTGHQVLIDGGPDPARLLTALGRVMPFWDRRLDLVILTAPQSERVAGLVPVLERYTVDWVLTAPESGGSDFYARWSELLAARPPGTVGVLWAGAAWPLDQGVTLHVFWPAAAESPGPLVLRLEYGATSILLPGAATTVVETALVQREATALRSTVLALPRHGAKTSSTPAFLQAVAPEQVIITVGADNPAGDPATVVLARVMDKPVYRTDQHGAVTVISDGRTLTVRPERPGNP